MSRTDIGTDFTNIIDELAERVAAKISGRLDAQGVTGTQGRSSKWTFSPDAPLEFRHEFIIWGFRILLGREPENDGVIELYAQCKTLDEFVGHLIRSREFQLRHLSGSQIGDLIPFEKQFVITELPDGKRFWINMQDRYVSRAIHANDYEAMETAFVRKTVRAGMRVLDVGANLGWFTIHMAALVGSTGHVDSFEPRADLFHYLSLTTKENGCRNVKLHNFALGDCVGEVELHWPSGNVNPGGTQLNMMGTESTGYSYQKIAMRVLDDEILDRVDFIKIDVEGAEKIVFAGAQRLLSACRPIIMSEISPDSLRQVSKISYDEYMGFLDNMGYSAFELIASGETGKRLSRWPFSDPSALMNVALIPNS